MKYLSDLANNQEYWAMMLNQAAVSVKNHEMWFIIVGLVVTLYISLWVWWVKVDKSKWGYVDNDNFIIPMMFMGLFVGAAVFISLCMIPDYNMAKHNPELWVLKQVVGRLP
mgnify:CR=1 FL=1